MPRWTVWVGGIVVAWLSIWGLGGKRTYPMSGFGSLLCSVLLVPALPAGFYSLQRLLRRDRDELADLGHEVGSALGGLGGMPLVILSPVWCFMVLSVARGLGKWDGPVKGSILDVAFAVIALHLLVWGAMTALGHAVRDDD